MLLMKVQEGVRNDICYFRASKMTFAGALIQIAFDLSSKISMDFVGFRRGSFCRKASQRFCMFVLEA